MSEAKPTARPWEVVKGGWPGKPDWHMIFHSQGKPYSSNSRDHAVCYMNDGEGADGKANAAHICHCVNLHEDLVGALKEAVAMFDVMGVDGGDVLKGFREVLKRAEGEQ